MGAHAMCGRHVDARQKKEKDRAGERTRAKRNEQRRNEIMEWWRLLFSRVSVYEPMGVCVERVQRGAASPAGASGDADERNGKNEGRTGQW